MFLIFLDREKIYKGIKEKGKNNCQHNCKQKYSYNCNLNARGSGHRVCPKF